MIHLCNLLGVNKLQYFHSMIVMKKNEMKHMYSHMTF